MKVLHNSQPDISTLSPWACGPQALGAHIRQTTHACVTTISLGCVNRFMVVIHMVATVASYQ